MSFIACMTVRISDCLFTGNAATYSGGGVEYYASPLIFTDCQFVDNDAGIGGGAMNGNDSDPVVIGCSFEGNTASGGGGVAFTDSRPNMINCRFDGNTAENSGGGMANNGGFNVLMNCTFANNSSIANGSAISNYMCSCSIINCILWENSTGPNTEVLLFENYWNDPHYVLTVAYSCIQGGWEGAGNIDADPLFADPANGDYRLQAGSPCIDAGTAGGAPGTDLLGVTRPQGLGFDMGAYEYASR